MTSRPPSAPRVTVLDALRRHWLLVILPAILLAVAGVAVAVTGPAKYSSEAQLNVGKADPTSPAFGGFVSAAAGLATVYSRSVDAPGVVTPLSRQLHWSQGLVASRLSATPIPNSPIIRVIGTAPSARDAELVANAGAAQLTAFVTSSNRNNPDAVRLYSLYSSTSLQKAQTQVALNNANKALANDPGNGALQAKVAQLTATADTLGQRLTALSGAYSSALAGQAATDVLTPLSAATSATDDRSSREQTDGGAGLLAGLVIGVGLAMWRANSVVRRRLAA